jgi:magnesium chelatase family protein
MVARINTVAFSGIDVQRVDVQVQISNGLPAFTIVGLPDKAVAESRERVRAALHALGIALPPKRLTVNLAPADLAKEGSHYDLPIALGLLAAMEILPKDQLSDSVVLGELSLDAGIRAVAGVLPAAIHAAANENRLICPAACGAEAAWAGDIEIIAPGDLLQLVNHIKGTQVLARPVARAANDEAAHGRAVPDLSAVRGQETAKRALEITAAGGHNLLMCGPPGSGKSMLASCLAGILPPLSPREALEVSMIHSLAGTLPDGGIVKARPYRDPHYSASLPALIGGGSKAKPGEISLAHNGVLFLDELPEFARGTLEALRQPLETGQALIARAAKHAVYPARFQLVAAMNPCRCGYLGDAERECNKAPRCAGEYQSKLSGPLLDRIDLRVDVPAVSIADLTAPAGAAGESSASVAARVARARAAQEARQGGVLNAHIPAENIENIIDLQGDAKELLTVAAEKMRLSARGYHRLLRVARTVADLDFSGGGAVTRDHVAESLSYRQVLGA